MFVFTFEHGIDKEINGGPNLPIDSDSDDCSDAKVNFITGIFLFQYGYSPLFSWKKNTH